MNRMMGLQTGLGKLVAAISIGLALIVWIWLIVHFVIWPMVG